LLELEPVTGRTNQLRIHCAEIKHPIVGDALYGGREFARLCLHAQKLGFFHPNGGWLEFETALPNEMQMS
jgi:23S rRNA-/tRNA-specific pseudouridylate synthase